jgi:hypothetical protein
VFEREIESAIDQIGKRRPRTQSSTCAARVSKKRPPESFNWDIRRVTLAGRDPRLELRRDGSRVRDHDLRRAHALTVVRRRRRRSVQIAKYPSGSAHDTPERHALVHRYVQITGARVVVSKLAGVQIVATQPSTQRARLTLLFDQVFSDEQLIKPQQYLTVNGVGGLILALFATALLLEPKHRDLGSAVLFGFGVAILALVLVSVARPQLLARSLVVQGLFITGLGVYFTVDTLVWALMSPPLTMFHYAPGAIAIAITYGVLQIAIFGASRSLTPKLRMTGLISGVALELVAAGCVIVRFLR